MELEMHGPNLARCCQMAAALFACVLVYTSGPSFPSWVVPAPECCPVVSFRRETRHCTLLPWLGNRTWSGNW